MMKDKLLKEGYKRYNQPEEEPILYQKKITDKKGIKYFINCNHYNTHGMNSWSFELQTESVYGTVNTTLFNTKDKTIHEIEMYFEWIWDFNGSRYYEEFAKGEKDGETAK